MRKCPNIPILRTDEQRADTLTAYGNRHGVTPPMEDLHENH
jgi:hypothetical protein